MTYIDRVLRTDRQYERFDDMTAYVAHLETLMERAGEIFPRHVQALELLHREAITAKEAARDAIEFDL